MLLERIYDEDLAQASYLIGCQVTGEAIIVDARRDISIYEQLADQHGMHIAYVTETHIHADYLSGSLELANKTGATLAVSDEGGSDWSYGSAFRHARKLKHQDTITIGNITLEAIHTPGHTPEHLSFLITDGAQADEPGFMLTGDFVFVGDIGRPDLLDKAAGAVDTRFQGAKDLFSSLKNIFLPLPDYVQVLPAHGSGSACGKSLGAIAASTVGYERHFSWWAPYIENNDEAGFIEALLEGQPDAHAYFGRMKRENRDGPAILGSLPSLTEFASEDLAAILTRGDAIFVDTRHHSEVHQGTVQKSLNIPGLQKAASYGAWVVNPEIEKRPIVLLADSYDSATQFRNHLIRVGIDTVMGYTTSLAGFNLVTPTTIHPKDLDKTDRTALIDVRNNTEYADGHIPGSLNLGGSLALWNLEKLPQKTSGPIITYCQSGVRNSVTASALRHHGFDVIELEGSYEGWADWKSKEEAQYV